jgi:hypothetical protein
LASAKCIAQLPTMTVISDERSLNQSFDNMGFSNPLKDRLPGQS